MLMALSHGAPASAWPVSIVGTSDLHGQVERTAALSGHLRVLRAARQEAGGGVVLVDAGDLFQGTLESNLGEGEVVINAYNLLGYDAAAIGNHEFDFGPEGPATMASQPHEDPRGALKARARQARFPILAANTIDESTGLPVAWPNVRPSTMVVVGTGARAVKIGLVGVTTKDTPKTTIAKNVAGLRFAPLEEVVTKHATALRAQGARIVVVVAHAGGKCDESAIRPPHTDLASCDRDGEIFRLARGLRPGLVDAIVAGHTHQALAHVENGIPIVQAWANGRGFSRIDFDVSAEAVKLVGLESPRRLCGPKSHDELDIQHCSPEPYGLDGKNTPVIVDQRLLTALAPALQKGRQLRERPLGIRLEDEFTRGYDRESALGNLFADLMREARPGTDVALMNGGGIRANLPAGPLTYGAVFLMMPFDNRFASATLTGAELRRVLERNLSSTKKGGILSISGVTLLTRCDGDQPHVTMLRLDGRTVEDDEQLVVTTTDFVALGGDGGLAIAEDRILLDETEPVREHLARLFSQRTTTLRSSDFYSAAAPRMRTLGQAQARCVASSSLPPTAAAPMPSTAASTATSTATSPTSSTPVQRSP
jgi:2',3'-cyclic-nucleotide 2'-phosphodiesterase (5'-nucleotidase family)